jgi:hypothetical protein
MASIPVMFLYLAAFEGDIGAVEALVALGGDPNDEPPPLAAACWGTGNDPAATTGIIDALVGAGADIHRRDSGGWSLLHAASMPYSHGDGYAGSPLGVGCNHLAVPGTQTCAMCSKTDGDRQRQGTSSRPGVDWFVWILSGLAVAAVVIATVWAVVMI